MKYFAQILNKGDVHIPAVTPDGSNIDTAINFATAIAAAIAVIMVVISGFRLVISAGNPEAVGTSRKIIIYALAGLIIIIAARLIVGIVLGRL